MCVRKMVMEEDANTVKLLLTVDSLKWSMWLLDLCVFLPSSELESFTISQQY